MLLLLFDLSLQLFGPECATSCNCATLHCRVCAAVCNTVQLCVTLCIATKTVLQVTVFAVSTHRVLIIIFQSLNFKQVKKRTLPRPVQVVKELELCGKLEEGDIGGNLCGAALIG